MSLVREGPLERAAHHGKRAVLGWLRQARWIAERGAPPVIATRPAVRIHALRVAIARGDGDPRLEAGKRHNLRLAAPAFDGLALTPARPLSFWRALGPTTAARGFRAGIEVRGGCVVPSLGGGLCLLSNALFTVAVELGWPILERHGHSIALAEPRALDATVAWPHVDLRIAPRTGRAVLAVRVDDDALVVEVWAAAPARAQVAVVVEEAREEDRDGARWRRLRVRRRVVDRAVIEDRVIVDDVKRVLAPAHGALRTCLSCDEVACATGAIARARVGSSLRVVR